MKGFFTWLVVGVLRLAARLAPRGSTEKRMATLPEPGERVGGYDPSRWARASATSAVTGQEYWYYGANHDATGTPVLCLHGLLLDGRTFAQLDTYCTDRRLIALDLPERSALYQGHMGDYAHVVEDFLATVGVSRCHLMGVSFGGVVALHLAAHPPRTVEIDSVILASAPIANATPVSRRQSHSTARWVSSQPDFRLFWFIEKVIGFSRRAYAAGHTGLAHVLRVKHPACYRQVALSLDGHDGTADAAAVYTPVLVLYGEHDALLNDHMRDALMRALPDEEHRVVHRAGHTMVYTHPQQVAGRLVPFLETRDGLLDTDEARGPVDRSGHRASTPAPALSQTSGSNTPDIR